MTSRLVASTRNRDPSPLAAAESETEKEDFEANFGHLEEKKEDEA